VKIKTAQQKVFDTNCETKPDEPNTAKSKLPNPKSSKKFTKSKLPNKKYEIQTGQPKCTKHKLPN